MRILPTFPAESIDLVLFSPPYWGLRDYGEGTETVWGGDTNCQHEWITERTERPNQAGGPDEKRAIKGVSNYAQAVDYHDRATYSDFCVKCGAWKGQLGLEPHRSNREYRGGSLTRQGIPRQDLPHSGKFGSPLGKNPGDVISILDLEDRKVRLIQRLSQIAEQLRGNVSYQGKSLQHSAWNEKLLHNKAYREALKILEKEEKLSEEEKQFLQDYVHNHAGHPKGKNPGDILSIEAVKKRIGDAHSGEATAGLYRPHKTHHEHGKNPGDVIESKYDIGKPIVNGKT